MSKGQIYKAMFAQGMITSAMSQYWNNGHLDLGESLMSGVLSVALGKVLEGVGTLLQKGSSFVKNSFERVLIENESSANKIAQMLDYITAPSVELATNLPGGGRVTEKAEKDDIQQWISKIISDAKNNELAINSTSQITNNQIIEPNETQVSEVNKVKDIKNDLKNSEHPHDYTRPGNYGEMKVDIDLESTGHYKRINNERVTSLDDPTHHGIDHVFKNYTPPPDYVIVDSKVLRADSAVNVNKAPSLSNTKSGRQLSNKWINKNIESAIEDEEIADEIIANLNDSNKVLRVTAKVDNTGKITYYKVGSDGKVIKEGKIPEIWIP